MKITIHIPEYKEIIENDKQVIIILNHSLKDIIKTFFRTFKIIHNTKVILPTIEYNIDYELKEAWDANGIKRMI
jgi:hypothetical protein